MTSDPASPPAPAPPRLRVVTGPHAGRELALERGRAVIGRSDRCDLPLGDNKASREHVAVRREDAAWLVEDLGSRNGTLLNGAKLEKPVALRPGDRIGVGLSEVEFLAAPSGAGTRLRVVDGPEAGREFALGPARTVIGRSPADPGDGAHVIALGDGKASREHSEFACVDGAWRVSDLESRNGTALNGDTIGKPVPLRSGDRVRVGATMLEFLDARVEDVVGSSLESLTLVERLGSGSMGVVYRANPHGGGPAQALKLLDPSLARDAPTVARFTNAARLLSRVQHPNLLRIAWCEVIGQQPATAMPLMTGSLAARIASEPLPAVAAVAIGICVARGLAAAAEKGLAHGALRPGNILFAADGSAVVADVGLSAPYDAKQPERSPPANWIAPEELAAIPADAEAIQRADQFALGAILHHAITGQLPWAAVSRTACAAARAKIDLPPLTAASAEVAAVVGRLLARSPNHRFRGWNEVAEAFTAAATGEAPEAPPGMRSALAPRPVTSSTRRIGASRRASRATEQIDIREALSPSNLGVPVFAIKGIAFLLATVVVAWIAIAVLGAHHDLDEAARPKPARPAPEPAQPVVPRQKPEAPASILPDASEKPTAPAAPEPSAPVAAGPGLAAHLVAATWVGGAGDQRIRDLAFAADGSVVAKGKGFIVRYDADGHGRIEGDPATVDAGGDDPAPAERTATGSGGATWHLATAAAHPLLQQTALTASAGWKMWGWSYADLAKAAGTPLVADVRAGDVWTMPDGKLGARLWCSAGNSSLTRDPHDLGKPLAAVDGAWQPTPHGPSTLVLRIDPASGTALSGTFLPGDVVDQAIDEEGRLYLPIAIGVKPGAAPNDAFGMSGRAGLTILDGELRRPLFSTTLGGVGIESRGDERLTRIAVRGNLVALAGYTTAVVMKTMNPVQEKPGGGKDGFLVIVKVGE